MSVSIKQNFLLSFFSNVDFDSTKSTIKYFGIIFLACILEVFLLVILLPPVLETNDDVMLNSIVSGALNNSPSEFILFSNIFIGRILKSFYTVLPTVNWYFWYLEIALFLGYFAIQYSFFRLKRQMWVKIINHFLILTLLAHTFLILQFTRVSCFVYRWFHAHCFL